MEQLVPASVGALNRVPCFEVERREQGIVAKRRADPYGPETAWYKIKNPTYTQAEGRRELFERG